MEGTVSCNLQETLNEFFKTCQADAERGELEVITFTVRYSNGIVATFKMEEPDKKKEAALEKLRRKCGGKLPSEIKLEREQANKDDSSGK